MRCQVESSVVSKLPCAVSPPATLTSTSRWPNRSATPVKTASTSSARVTSITYAAWRGAPGRPAATSSAADPSRSVTATRAPSDASRSAQARPIPCAAPVTTAAAALEPMHGHQPGTYAGRRAGL